MASLSNTDRVPPLIAALEALYEQHGMSTVWEERERAFNSALLAFDFSLEYRIERDRFEMEDPSAGRTLRRFRSLIQSRRENLLQLRIGDLHRNWSSLGGRFLKPTGQAVGPAPSRFTLFQSLPPDATLEAYLKAMHQGDPLVGGAIVAVISNLFGMIDPTQLNRGLNHYASGAGQVMLLSALAVATGRSQFKMDSVLPIIRGLGVDPSTLGWKRLPFSWTRAAFVLRHRQDIQPGKGGYRDFAIKYANGHMGLAFMLASAILTDQEFTKLSWGPAVMLTVDEYDAQEMLLIKGLTEGFLKGRDGWLTYMNYQNRVPETAYRDARVILGDRFEDMEWPGETEAVELVRRASEENAERVLTDLGRLMRGEVSKGDSVRY